MATKQSTKIISEKMCSFTPLPSEKSKTFNIQFTMNSLPSVTGIRDLGLYIDQDLKLNVHIQNIVGKARKMNAIIMKNFKTTSHNIIN